ncbi:hypothetical protein E1B28_004986 [Marasmius oreades]|uniref:Uncharacterized protein n=1 Tax=Marasmius oreades TaxID=181124 RepID=A0A9P7UZS5_9AGAR|nr:uncharacterized protein E1B28_004986 [Marasmius oreades]KAG7097658.1 hypothetical protein E1B28_004986 [Marasmius oreades]
MSFFQDACGVSIEQGTFNAIMGNQINHFYKGMAQQKKEEHTIYDEFYRIKLGAVHRIRDIHCEFYPRRWDIGIREWCEGGRFRVDRTICAAKIRGEQGSGFTVISYSGPEKDEVEASVFDLSCEYKELLQAWKEDFQRFSKATNTMKMQLFGINRSTIPLLIFYGELVPLAHLWDRVGRFGKAYTRALSLNMDWGDSEIWIDPAQGTLVHGVEGPYCDLLFLNFPTTNETLPSSVELLLDEDVCFRYLSRLPLDKDFDRRVIDLLHFGSDIGEERSPIISKPCVFSSKTNSIIAVGSPGNCWKGYGCLKYRVAMPDGRTRFTFTDESSELELHAFGAVRAWLSQASSVFNRLGILLDEELSSYKLIVPVVYLRGSIENSSIKHQRRSEDPPIYFFLHPLPSFPLGDNSDLFTHTWSYDENGETPIPHHHCEYLGLPIKLYERLFSSRAHRWPSKTYKNIHKWQIARGFDPTTADFARYLDHPNIYEVLPESDAGRFEELNIGLPGRSSAEKSSSQDDLRQYSTVAAYNTEEDSMNLDSPIPASIRSKLSTSTQLQLGDVDMELDQCSIPFEGLSTASASIADMEVD